jgi:fatty-acid desaturase
MNQDQSRSPVARFLPTRQTSIHDLMPFMGLNWPTILWLSAMHIGAATALFYPSKANLMALLTLYFITGCLGITMTYHRLLAHRTFALPKWLERVFVTCGALAMQGGPMKWSAQHRMHHANPDTEMDPHNSHRGFLHCHVAWMFVFRPQFDGHQKLLRFTRDIHNDAYYRWLDTPSGQFLPQFILAATLFAIGGTSMLLWGTCLRMVLVYHGTWCVNSATHFFGYRNYNTADKSRNTWWVALITFGEGWHNNHHAHQGVAEAGHKWWEIDITMLMIRLLNQLGFVTKLKSIRDVAHRSRQASAIH